MSKLPELERVTISKIRVFSKILEEQFMQKEEGKKQEFRQAMLQELEKVKDKLMVLLEENERVTDIERLERDEFVIDVSRKNKVEGEGDLECSEIRKEAEKTVLRLELLRDRVKKSTWDTMEVHQKAIKSI